MKRKSINNPLEYIKKETENGNLLIGKVEFRGENLHTFKIEENVSYKNDKGVVNNLNKGDYFTIDKNNNIKYIKEEDYKNLCNETSVDAETLFGEVSKKINTTKDENALMLKNKHIKKIQIKGRKVMAGLEYLKNTKDDINLIKDDKKDDSCVIIIKTSDEKKADKIQAELKKKISKEILEQLKEKAKNIDKMTKAELQDFKRELNGLYDSVEASVKDKEILNEISRISDNVDEKIKTELEEREENGLEIDELSTNASIKSNQNFYELDDDDYDDPYAERSLF